MDFYFFDSSAIVKNYVAENGSDWVKATLNAPDINIIYAVSISKVEVVSALMRRVNNKSITAKDAVRASDEFKFSFSNEFRVVDIDSEIIESAVSIAEEFFIRGYDSIQLSAALRVSDFLNSLEIGSLILVSSDQELNTAAQAFGIVVVDPSKYE
jgi:predicted nucleic acid-binding protein